MSILPVFLQGNRDYSSGQRSIQQSNHRMILGVTPDGALTLVNPPNQPWIQPPISNNRNISISNRNDFEINLDIHHFGPEDISVKTVDNFLIIEAGHDEKRDEYGWVKRQFTRRYALPDGCDIDAIECRLSSDGVLTVTAPRGVPRNERTVPIMHTGPVRSVAEVRTELGNGEAPETIAGTLQ